MIGTIQYLVLAALVFVGSHIALSSPPLRDTLVARLGEQGFAAAYSAAAVITLGWLVIAFGDAPYVELWGPQHWTRWLPVVVMPLAALFLVCGYSQYNPTAVASKLDPKLRDPAPGIMKVTRHPIMWAIGLWALAHIPPNGDVASLILFGSLGFLALYGTTRIDAKRRARDPEGFQRFTEVTSNLPFVALLSPAKRRFAKTAYGTDPLKALWGEIGLWRVTAALALYVALIVAHPWFTGVSAAPH